MENKPEPIKKRGIFPQNKPINPERLAEELKAALGEKLLTLDTGQMVEKQSVDAEGNAVITQDGPFIYVTVSATATEADQAATQTILDAHDPANLSARQQQEKEAIAAYARLAAADFGAIRKLEQAEKLDALLDLMEDWQRLMVAARG